MLQSNNPDLKDAGPLSIALAGPSAVFLIVDIFFYWGVLAMIEYNYIHTLKQKFSKKNKVQNSPSRRASRRSTAGKKTVVYDENMEREEDVINEEIRIGNI